MIWEIDEDCDQAVNWQEFQAMYSRCSNDQAGELQGSTISLALLIFRPMNCLFDQFGSATNNACSGKNTD